VLLSNFQICKFATRAAWRIFVAHMLYRPWRLSRRVTHADRVRREAGLASPADSRRREGEAPIDAAFSLVRFALAMNRDSRGDRSGDRAQWARSFRCALPLSRFPRPAMGVARLAEDRTRSRNDREEDVSLALEHARRAETRPSGIQSGRITRVARSPATRTITTMSFVPLAPESRASARGVRSDRAGNSRDLHEL